MQIDLPDPKDLIFYETFLTANTYFETVLIIENLKHFQTNEKIMNPRDFLDFL